MPSFKLSPYSGSAWRFVEVQHKNSTMKLVDDLDAQATLEHLLDETKPPVPADCSHLNYLLFTPFRYPARQSTRFRRAGSRSGVFYCAEEVETAAAEIAFYKLLFFLESPETPVPTEPFEMTAFSVALSTRRAVDITQADLSAYHDPVDYDACHKLSDEAREVDAHLIRFRSVRHKDGVNLAVLNCAAFAKTEPQAMEAWKFRLSHDRVIVLKSYGGGKFEFMYTSFTADSRIKEKLDSKFS